MYSTVKSYCSRQINIPFLQAFAPTERAARTETKTKFRLNCMMSDKLEDRWSLEEKAVEEEFKACG